MLVEHLRLPTLPTANAWTLVWVPAIADASFWYIAQGPDAGGKPSYAIVVRGTTLFSIQSLKEDFEVTLKPLPFTDPTAPADVRIAEGFATGHGNLVRAVSP